MDCQTALEHLDCVRPDSDDLDLPEMADARAHLQHCDACRQTFTEIQNFDHAVFEVVQNVDVPERLRSSLLDVSVNKASSAVDHPTADKASSDEVNVVTGSRRRTVLIAAATACTVILAATAWFRQSPPVQFTELELLQRLPLNLAATEQFDASFELGLPATWSGNRRLRVGREFRGLDLDDSPGHDAAVVIFSYSPSRNAPVSGILAAIPASRVAPLPNSASFSQADSQYIQKDGGRPVAAVWKERDIVYVCMVLGSAADLEQIQRNLSTSAA